MNINVFKWLAAMLVGIVPSCGVRVDTPSEDKSPRKLHFEISAQIPGTKTSIEGTEKPGEPGKYVYTPMWAADDHVAVLFSANEASVPKEELANSLSAGETALFTGDIAAPATGTASVIYPYSAWTGGKSGYATLKAAQEPALTSFDPSCDILCAEPKAFAEDGGTVSVSGLLFHRLTGVLRIELTGSYAAGNHIQSLKMTVPEGIKLAGNFSLDFDTASINTIASGSNVVTATYGEEDGPVIGAGSVFLSLLPCTIAKNSQVTIEVRTESYDIVKTITLKEAMTIPQGGVAVLKLSVTDTHCTSLLEREGWTTTQVASGLKWHNFEGTDPVTSNPQIVNVVEADLSNPGLRLSFVYSATDKKVSEIAAARSALAVVNATYGARQAGIVHIKTDGTVRRTIDVEAGTEWKYKAAVWYDGLSSLGFYNRHQYNATSNKNKYEADTHRNLFSSAPLLIDNGSHAELNWFTDGTNVAEIHPRTVLAVTRSGRLLLMTIDGRLSTAKGMTCAEMQDFLDRFFAPVYAINMDGGGSTAMYVAGNDIVNYPCDGTAEDAEDVSRDHTAERSLPSFFAIDRVVKGDFDPIPEEADDSEWYLIR